MMPNKCIKCGEPLERIRYKFAYLPGQYCQKCAYELYRELGLSYFCVDADDDYSERVEKHGEALRKALSDDD